MQDLLASVTLFKNLNEADLARAAALVQEIDVAAGDILFHEGDASACAYIICAGQVEVIKRSQGRDILLAVEGRRGVIGEMSLIDRTPRTATVRARTDVHLAVIGQEQFDHLLATSPSAARAITETVLSRWRKNQSLLRQAEKMTQLGTLVAGMAHELNNPAAALRSGAEALRSTLPQVEQTYQRLRSFELTGEQQRELARLTSAVESLGSDTPALGALAQSDLEAEFEAHLERCGVPDAWQSAPLLVELGYDTAGLAALTAAFPGEQLAAVLDWLEARHAIQSLLAEIGSGAQRITKVVGGLLTYAHLDSGTVEHFDIHEALDDALRAVEDKLAADVAVHRVYAADLPPVEGYGTELEQVWRHLVDNAADALNGSGDLTLRTRRDGAGVCVEVEDNGPGIPPEVQARIFEPFFTTKPPGKGAGLGLYTSYSIVALKHRGEITVESQPGRTVFRVWLPTTLPHS